MGQIKAYISHSIRGKYGVDATDEQMEENNRRAIEFGKLMRKEFPNVNFYVPGDRDEFVVIAYRKKFLTEKQLLEVDCAIIDECNFMLVYSPDDYISRGMKVEIDHCVYTHTPVISAVDGTYDEYIAKLIQAINCYLVTLMR